MGTAFGEQAGETDFMQYQAVGLAVWLGQAGRDGKIDVDGGEVVQQRWIDREGEVVSAGLVQCGGADTDAVDDEMYLLRAGFFEDRIGYGQFGLQAPAGWDRQFEAEAGVFAGPGPVEAGLQRLHVADDDSFPVRAGADFEDFPDAEFRLGPLRGQR